MSLVPFFVYGSMSEGMVHFDKIKDFISSSRPAIAQGTSYRLKVGFPVFIQSGMDQVPGQLIELKMTDLLQHLLDEFHGFNQQQPEKSLYFRSQITVQCQATKEALQAWTYTFNPDKIPAGATRIEGGDWSKSLTENPPITAQLSEKQRAYILKLGASSGRDIVPIDLGLYRELMNLEMIVDKGRRLALSKLGQEVYRFLD